MTHLLGPGSRYLVLTAALVLLAGVATPARAQLVDISTSPLYGGKQAHPNVVVTTSVEFPTVGAAYKDIPYVKTSTYLGYFDPTRCYDYSNGNGGYFLPQGLASANHECSNEFSGNFMNWATMSAIDEFRYAMTGGNRVDESGPNQGTIIERAYLPDGTVAGVPDFYALPSNFPRITLYNGTINGQASSFASAVLPAPVQANSLNLYMTNCKSQVYFSTATGGSCASPSVVNGGAYNVRILVCDNTEGPRRTDLCLQYGGNNGRHKPVGEVQRNADKMRFASFGYLMDRASAGYNPPCNDSGWNRCRYGGVLRNPMKYVGPTNYDSNQVPSTNTRNEINADGTLRNDPENTASSAGGAYSGFINYINKFGASGVYKRYDTMGEMYYEAIRYYQNLGPTPEAITGTINNATKDFFPFESTWTDPIQSTCSANYIVNLSDANTWDDTYLPGYAGSPAAGYGRGTRAAVGGLDAYAWTAKIAALESGTTSLSSNDVRPGLSNIQNQSTGAGNASYLAAGAAYWANTNDIRTGILGKQTVKTISFDVAEPSLAIQDRQLYLMGKYGGFNNTIDRLSDADANPFFATNTSNPAGPAIRSNSEWEDSPGSGYPSSYLLASDPLKLINGLRAAFARISSQSGTLSGAALTSANLTYGSAGAYVATFDPARWSGSVLYKSLSVSGGSLVVSASAIWDAGSLLTARCGTVNSGSTVCTDTDTSTNKRNIVTTLTLGGLRVARDFTWANVSTDSAYAGVLNTNPSTGVVDSRGQERLNYLRGFRADEASALTLRGRDSAMGDIVNSGPVFVGPPTTSITDAGYQTFYNATRSRLGAVYVGANDGMLHAFNAASGQELFGYVPSFVAPDLNDLTDSGYVHKTYVDAVPSIAEVRSNGSWKTLLVSGVGAGAQGVFALDVTDPAAFGPTKVVFEFSDADDADLGNVLASPEIVKLQTGVSGGVPSYSYFAVVTGYNNRRTTVNGRTDASVSTDTNNRGVLFLLSLNRTLGTPWVLGTNYYKYYFPATNAAVQNGLGPVSTYRRRDGSGAAEALYFGDLQGNLWRFNTAGTTASSWGSARSSGSTPLPIFNATTVGGAPQPITARPEISTGPYGSTMIFFGTGQYLGAADLSTPYVQQSQYAIIDSNSTPLIRRTDLQARTATLTAGTIAIAGSPFVYSGSGSRKGWVIDFPSSTSGGERSITKPAVSSGFLTFTTLTLATDICGIGGGYIYQVNALSGLPLAGTTGGYTSTVGIPGPPRVVDLVITGGQLRATGEQVNLKKQATLVSGTSSNIASNELLPRKASPVGRINWREITNYNDRH